jgi:hypothetical protein
MAIAIPRKMLTKEHEIFISKHLTIAPVDNSFMAKKKKYSSNSSIDAVRFWMADPQYVHLPLLFGSSIFKVYPDPNSYPKTNIQFTGRLRDTQPAVIAEAWEQLRTYGTTTLSLYTGFGKTIVGAYICCALGYVVMVTFTLSTLMKQWKETFTNHTNARVWVVGEDPDPEWSPGQPLSFDVIVCMDQRVKKIPADIRAQVGVLIPDEAHLLCTPSAVSVWLSVHPLYVIIETATLERDDDMHAMAYAVAGKHAVYRASTTPFTVYKVITNTSPKGTPVGIDGTTNWHALEADITGNLRRLEIIYQFPIYAYPDDGILIITRHVSHAKAIAAGLRQRNVDVQEYHSNISTYTDCRVLVGTVAKIGTGFDQASACPNYSGRRFRVLMIASSIKKKTQLIQTIGRVVFRAENPVVIHLVDNYKTYKSHWYQAKKVYETRHGNITEIDVPNPNAE